MAKGSAKTGADANELAVLVLRMAGKEKSLDVEVTKEKAAADLWKLALASSATRMELAKTIYADVASRLLENGTPEEQHVCAGLLAVMAADQDASEAILRNAVSSRIVNTMNRTFVSESGHDRSKITAAELFFHLTGYRTTTVRLAAVVPAAVSLLSKHRPRWSNTAAARASVAGGLLRLIQAALVPESRIRHPELLETIIAPMAMPTGISTLLSSLAHGATFLTAKSAACLYWVVTHRGGKLDCLDTAVAQRLLALALVSEPERQAYVLGSLAQVAVAHPAKAAIGAAHGCSIVTRVLRAALFTSRGRPVPLQALPPFVPMVVEHAAALAYQLSFVDAGKRALLTAGCAPLLVALMKSKNPAVHECCTGALFHMGLEPDGGTRLAEATAPRYLLPPVPLTWLASENCPTNLPRRPRPAGAAVAPSHEYHPSWDKALHLLPDETP